MAEREAMAAIEWKTSVDPVPYPEAVEAMERRVAAIRAGTGREMAWLLEHPPLITAGASAREAELIDAGDLPVYATGRGGRYTYHGPGQRVAYVMLDIRRRNPDIRAYVRNLEAWLIQALARFGIVAARRQGRVGIWVAGGGGAGPAAEHKIAAIGVRVRQGVTYHGVSLNVDPDLDHYAGIVPCGITDYGVTSMAKLGVAATMAEVDEALKACFEEVFGVETVPV